MAVTHDPAAPDGPHHAVVVEALMRLCNAALDSTADETLLCIHCDGVEKSATLSEAEYDADPDPDVFLHDDGCIVTRAVALLAGLGYAPMTPAELGASGSLTPLYDLEQIRGRMGA